jgi:hypothetical protein
MTFGDEPYCESNVATSVLLLALSTPLRDLAARCVI